VLLIVCMRHLINEANDDLMSAICATGKIKEMNSRYLGPRLVAGLTAADECMTPITTSVYKTSTALCLHSFVCARSPHCGGQSFLV